MNAPSGEFERAWLVSGHVQGVAFRASARRRALELGLVGLAENLPDGRVRVVAAGGPEALERFAGWLADGPSAARVSDVSDIAFEGDLPEGFAIR